MAWIFKILVSRINNWGVRMCYNDGIYTGTVFSGGIRYPGRKILQNQILQILHYGRLERGS